MITVIVKHTIENGRHVSKYYYRGVHLGTAHTLEEMDNIQYVIRQTMYASRTYFNGVRFLIQ